MISVEVRVDAGIGFTGGDWIPHTTLVVTDENGVKTQYDFYPQISGLTGSGEVGSEVIDSDNLGHHTLHQVKTKGSGDNNNYDTMYLR